MCTYTDTQIPPHTHIDTHTDTHKQANVVLRSRESSQGLQQPLLLLFCCYCCSFNYFIFCFCFAFSPKLGNSLLTCFYCNLQSPSRFYREAQQWLLRLPSLALACSEGKISLELAPRILYQLPPHPQSLYPAFLWLPHWTAQGTNLKCEDPSQHSPPRVPTFCFPPFWANCFIMCFLKLLCSLGINFVLIFTNRKVFTTYCEAVSVLMLLGDHWAGVAGVLGNNTLSRKEAATQCLMPSCSCWAGYVKVQTKECPPT